ncbi:Retrovirus-related Pol polyprotein from type-1 retrotransposable element R2 [Araneus ventricosus]|uniref:Retrovirus-related Pol polyprotein from type-1 retrotransposable element R2 n=1 Tax=Araneus ventricosus TaxID=182803 RepID=A0A4Y1ZYF9_ARAVE|nr:Retrovirus-related Pol polyprotein from type-1 retrotransposable element R2 [Araneus ventricosus]
MSSTCDCSKDSASNVTVCSPICRRTRAQVAKRQQSQLSAVSSSVDPSVDTEICSATNTDSSNIELDTTLGSTVASSSEASSLPSTCDSQPNFSMGECPLIVNDALIVSVMLNELIDIICDDPSSQHCETRTNQFSQDICLTSIERTDGEICLFDKMEIFACEMVNSIFNDIFDTNSHVSISPAKINIDDSPIQFSLHSSNEIDLAGENDVSEGGFEDIARSIVNDYEINQSTVIDPFVSPVNVSTNEDSKINNEIAPKADNVDPLEHDISDNTSFLEIIDSDPDEEMPNVNEIDQISNSIPNFSLEVDFKSSQIPPITKIEKENDILESHVSQDLNLSQQSSGLPDSDEIGIVQFVTKNKSSLTIHSLLPHERVCHPTTSTVEVFSCEYCEKKFTSESAAQAHIFDLHIETDLKIPSFQVQQSITFVRNYPDPGCSSCSIGFLSLHLLSQHCLTVHNSDKFACAFCNSDFPTLNNFYTHRCRDTCPPPKPFKCEVCEEAFESSHARADHVCAHTDAQRSISPDETNSAVLLPLMAGTCDAAGNHASSELPLFSCMFCEESFISEDSLAQHIAHIHLSFDLLPFSRKCQSQKKSFSSCKNCKKVFASSASRLTHTCTEIQKATPSSNNQASPHPDQVNNNVNNTSIQNPEVNSDADIPTPAGRHTSSPSVLTSNAGPSNESSLSRKTNIDSGLNTNVQQSQNRDKITWRCDVPGCKVIKKSKKGLSIHKFRQHNIPFPKRDVPSNTQPSQTARADQTQQVTGGAPAQDHNIQSSLQVDDPNHVQTQQCPTHTSRSGGILNILFPVHDPTPCTEPECIFDSRGKTWSSIKCSLLRHLRTAHRLSDIKAIHWCATCTCKFVKPSKHACLKHGAKIDIHIDSDFQCPECGEKFSNELALRNHVKAHTKANAKASAVQRIIPRMGSRKWKKKKNGNSPSSEPPDEVISNQNAVLAPPLIDNSSLPEPPQEEVAPRGPLSVYIDHLEDFLNQDPSQEFFDMFCETMDMAVVDIKNISFQPSPTSADHNSEAPIRETLPGNHDHPPQQTDLPQGRKIRKEININDAQSCQTLYGRNRKRAVREICEGPPIRCQIPVNLIEDHFRAAWDSNHPPLSQLPTNNEGRPPTLERPFSISEVSKKLANAENTSPGPDRLTYHHWRSLKQGAKFLTCAFNACLHFQKIPQSWKKTTTILIPKTKSNLDDVTNWRPIALSNTIYKVYTKVLAGRLQDWATRFNALSPCQKGFTPFDGVLEHNFVLQTRLETARARKHDLCVAWLDVTNAFGALPHQLIYQALTTAGTGEDFVNIIRDLYTGCTTNILSNNSATNPIDISSGVKQGCPISGLLFNISIDHILRKIQGTATSHRILAFADDLCLLGDSSDELQDMLDTVFTDLAGIGLHLNPRKSFSMHFSGSTPVNVPATTFRLGASPLQPILEFDFTKFLGKPVGFNPVPDYGTFNSFGLCAKKLLASLLSPWQKIDAMKSFLFPAFQFVMRTGQFSKEDWSLLDNSIRHAVKEVLCLPEHASNEYLYGHTKAGCVGLPVSAEESDLNRVDSAFKLLTSSDEMVSELALKNLSNTVSKRSHKSDVTDDDLSDFLSGAMELDCEGKPGSNPYSNVWTVACIASRRQKIEWSFTDGVPQLKFQDIILKGSSRRKILFSIRNRLRQDRALALTAKPDQGKVMECVAMSPTSSHFIGNGLYTRFSEYRFIHRARLNLLPLNGLPWKEGANKRCRRCDKADLETLPHVINHCEAHSRAWQLRHDNIQNRVLNAAQNSSAEIIAVNKKIVKSINLRPDIVLKLDNVIYLVDITCPFENRIDGFEKAKQEKLRKYQVLIEHLLPQASAVEIVPIVVGALGAWDPANDKFLLKIMAKSYLKTLSKLCVSDNIRWARDIYVEHITGIRQFDESAIVNNPNFRPQEPCSQDDPLAVSNHHPPSGTVTTCVPPAVPGTSASISTHPVATGGANEQCP